jgi:hypothetical protein
MTAWKVIIPMAGRGRRMAGLTAGKPKMLHRLEDGQTLLEVAIGGLATAFPDADWTFVALEDHASGWGLEEYCRSLIISPGGIVAFETVPAVTSGQLATVMVGLDGHDARGLVIHNCDTYVRFGQIDQELLSSWDFVVPVFSSEDPAYSFCEIDPATGQIVRIAEKQVLPGGHASSGTYIVKDSQRFHRAAAEVLSQPPVAENPEHYVSLAMQCLLESGARGTIVHLDECIPLGTPEEVQRLSLDLCARSASTSFAT